MTDVTAAVKGLRDLADFIEQHPELPWGTSLDDIGKVSVQVGYGLGEDAAEVMAAFARGGGRWEKKPDEQFFAIERSFGPIAVEVWTSRGMVCERVVVGTETVIAPDPVALAAAKASVPTIEVEREIVEWKCHPILAQVTA